MQYVMAVDVPDEYFDGDDSIDVAARIVNDYLKYLIPAISVRPLSEVIAC